MRFPHLLIRLAVWPMAIPFLHCSLPQDALAPVSRGGSTMSLALDGGGGSCTPQVMAVKPRPLDVVVTMDTSGSMSEEILAFNRSFQQVFDRALLAGGVDRRVVVVASKGLGTFQLCVHPPLGGPNCNSNPPLYRAVNQTVASTNALSLLLSTYRNANAALDWSTELRPDSTKMFLVITDDNSSLAGTSFDTQLLAKLPEGMFGTAAARKYILHGIIGVTADNSAIKCPTAVNNGAQYQVLANLTGGLVLPVCDADYTSNMQQLANHVLKKSLCQLPWPAAEFPDAGQEAWSLQRRPSMGGPAIPIARVKTSADCTAGGWFMESGDIRLCTATCDEIIAQPVSVNFELVTSCQGI